MRKRQVVYSRDATLDRSEIARWLTIQASADVAQRFDLRIRQAIRGLEYASERGTMLDKASGLWIIGILPTVAVAFSVEQDAVIIHRILYQGRNWAAER